jgi:hypothetical protein
MSFYAKMEVIKGLKWIRIMLTSAFITEFINEFIDYYSPYGSVFSHFYLLLEHTCLSMFILSNLKIRKLNDIIKLIAIFFSITSLLISISYQKFMSYPGIQYNINCFLIIGWCCLLMLKIEVFGNIRILKLPLFWLLSGILLFYSGIFFFNGTYSYILKENKNLAFELRRSINLTLNCIFYIIWTYSFVCSVRIQRLFTQQ